MMEPPKAKQATTDMIAPLARLELTVYKAKMSRTSGQSPEALEATVAELEDLIQGKYLRYCDPSEPMHYTIMVGARAAILNARLRTRLIRVKRGIASVSEKNEVFTMALKLLDYDAAVMSGPLASRYSWQFRVFFSWEVPCNSSARSKIAVMSATLGRRSNASSPATQILSRRPGLSSSPLHALLCVLGT